MERPSLSGSSRLRSTSSSTSKTPQQQPLGRLPSKSRSKGIERKSRRNQNVGVFSEEFVRRLAGSIHAHQIIQQHRARDAELETKYNSLAADVRQMQDAIQQAVLDGASNSSERLGNLRIAEEATREQVASLVMERTSVKEEIATGDGRLAVLDSEVRRLGGRCLNSAGLLNTVVKGDGVWTWLFEGACSAPSQDRPGANDIETAAAGSQETGTRSGWQSKMPSEIAAAEMIDVERREAIQHLTLAQQRLDRHRQNCKLALQQHQTGVDPGLTKWSADWDQTTFDLHHLQETMMLSRQFAETEDYLSKVLNWAKDTALEPLTGQRFQHPDHASDGYAEALTIATIRGAPISAIEQWQNGMPQQTADPERTPSPRSGVDDAVFNGVRMGESMSCVAEPRMRAAIRQAQLDAGDQARPLPQPPSRSSEAELAAQSSLRQYY